MLAKSRQRTTPESEVVSKMIESPNEPEEVSANQIRADVLCVMTGLTDRRLRQLATQGFYPPPNRGVYQREETLRGLFRYYREREENDTSALRKEEQGYMRAKRRAAELDLDLKLGTVVPIEASMYIFSNTFLPLRQRLYRLPIDVAHDCVGKDRGQIQKILENKLDAFIDETRESFDLEKYYKEVLEESGVKKRPGENEDDESDTTNP